MKDGPNTYVPIIIGDYLKHTTRLTTEQHGAYFLLIMDYWINGSPPDDDVVLARITGMAPRTWKTARAALSSHFDIIDGRWTQDRVEAELVEAKNRKDRARAGAVVTNAKRWGKKTSLERSLQRSDGDHSSGRTPSASTVAITPNSVIAHSGKNEFLGPPEIREAFVLAMGEDWCRSYIDPCGWQEVPERGLTPASQFAATKIIRDARAVLVSLGVSLIERRIA